MRKYKILIIELRNYPNGNATSEVVSNLAEALLLDGHKVRILSLAIYPEDEALKTWNGIEVSNRYDAELMPVDHVREALRSKPLSTCKAIVLKLLYKTFRKLNPTYKKYGMNPAVVHAYKKHIIEEVKTEHYDLLLPAVLPQESVWAIRVLRNRKKTDVPYAVLQYDTYWNSNIMPQQYREDRFAFEKQFTEDSLFVMATPQITRLNVEKEPALSGKIISTEFPAIKKSTVIPQNWVDDGKIHCLFVGTLYRGIRPPEKVIRIISQISDKMLVFEFYGSGQELITTSPDYEAAAEILRLHGSVPLEEAIKLRNQADFLVNIDNTNLTQVPSKIFEYISTGKPIINFYFDDRSPSLDYLKKYPSCININVNTESDKQAALQLEEFIALYQGVLLPFETVAKLYEKNTPEYVAKQCIVAYERAMGIAADADI